VVSAEVLALLRSHGVALTIAWDLFAPRTRKLRRMVERATRAEGFT